MASGSGGRSKRTGDCFTLGKRGVAVLVLTFSVVTMTLLYYPVTAKKIGTFT
jgi:hypothetical protein